MENINEVAVVEKNENISGINAIVPAEDNKVVELPDAIVPAVQEPEVPVVVNNVEAPVIVEVIENLAQEIVIPESDIGQEDLIKVDGVPIVDESKELVKDEPKGSNTAELSGKEGQGNNDSSELNIQADNEVISVIEAEGKTEVSGVDKESRISVAEGEEVIAYLKNKIEKSDGNPRDILKLLRDKLSKAESDSDQAIDELDANSIGELFNDVRNVISSSYSYENVEKFDKLKQHLDDSLKSGNVDKLKKLQSSFLSWHDKLHGVGDKRFTDVSDKLKSFATALNVLIDGLRKKEKELNDKIEESATEEKKSIVEIKDMIKAKISKKKIKKDGNSSLQDAATEIQNEESHKNVKELKDLIKKKTKKNWL